MDLQTRIHISAAVAPINYESQLALWGSCFSTHIGEKCKQAQFRTQSNPFGVIFNPIPIAVLFERMASGRLFTSDDFFEFQEQWYSFAFHSQLSQSSEAASIELANQALLEAIEFIKGSSHLFITLGSAWGYVLAEGASSDSFAATKASDSSELWVANCHKQPAASFVKKMATQSQLHSALQRIQQAVLQLNPHIHLIFTVSPVRHLKDGLQENSRSKAALLTAMYDFMESASPGVQDQMSYFPAFEIQMDQLRDYRFYQADMTHPTEQAVSYIWERFKEAYMSPACLKFMERVSQVQRDLNHRPFQENSAAHTAFKAKVKDQIRGIKQQYPWMFPLDL